MKPYQYKGKKGDYDRKRNVFPYHYRKNGIIRNQGIKGKDNNRKSYTDMEFFNLIYHCGTGKRQKQHLRCGIKADRRYLAVAENRACFIKKRNDEGMDYRMMI